MCPFCTKPCGYDHCAYKENMIDVKITGGLQLVKNTVEVSIKKLAPEAVIPKYVKNGDAGMDITAISMTETDLYIEYGTGLAIQLPSNYVGLIYPRSSLSNFHLVLSNHVGVIDSGYTGEIRFRFKKTQDGPNSKYYQVGDRIGQLIVMPYPLVLFNEVTELEETSRGFGGFGSSGK
jgi:dUTP pyrophosphatase